MYVRCPSSLMFNLHGHVDTALCISQSWSFPGQKLMYSTQCSSRSPSRIRPLVPEVCINFRGSHVDDQLLCFRALLTSELEQIIREAYARAMGKTVADSGTLDKSKRMPSEEDDCPICYDAMHGVAEAGLVFCEECSNAVHKECFGECAYFSPRSQGFCH